MPIKLKLMLSIAGFLLASSVAADVVTAMTFNLRVPVDPAPNDWVSRLPRIATLIQAQQPDVIGLQEVTPHMMRDVGETLTNYEVVGRGREEGGNGEGTQILFLKSRWHLDPQDYGTLQLSPTPDVPGSNGWGMPLPRILTWVHLQEKTTGKFIYIYNTHFPLAAHDRDLSAGLVAKTIAERKYIQHPVILTGDFNACQNEDSMQYLLGLGNSPIALQDTYQLLHPNEPSGTFHNFGRVTSCKVDYIYVSEEIKTLEASIIKETKNFASDHYPVTAKLHF